MDILGVKPGFTLDNVLIQIFHQKFLSGYRTSISRKLQEISNSVEEQAMSIIRELMAVGYKITLSNS